MHSCYGLAAGVYRTLVAQQVRSVLKTSVQHLQLGTLGTHALCLGFVRYVAALTTRWLPTLAMAYHSCSEKTHNPRTWPSQACQQQAFLVQHQQLRQLPSFLSKRYDNLS